jgi:predicted nucleic acid-binding protein
MDPLLETACQGLGAGERGAILLAKSLAADLVLLDESKARRIARAAGLAIMGCLVVWECLRRAPAGASFRIFAKRT